jgi:hypothetical protein
MVSLDQGGYLGDFLGSHPEVENKRDRPPEPVPFEEGFCWSILCFWHDQPEEQVERHAGYAARDEGDQEGQAEPEGADPKELSQAAANAGQDTVTPGAAQGIVLGGCVHVFSPYGRLP